MKSLSVHGIDPETGKAIKERAKTEGKSVNRIVKDLIAKSLGSPGLPPDNSVEFADLCGAWTEAEAAEFLERLEEFEAVNEKDWR